MPPQKNKIKYMSKEDFKEISNERKELVLPRDVSFCLKVFLKGQDGMCIPSGYIEKLVGDEKEYFVFAFGVEQILKDQELTDEVYRNLQSLSKSIASDQISNIVFNYKLDESLSPGIKSILLLNGMDYWNILWKGWYNIYNDPEKYDENYRISNKIHYMINSKGSKVNINDITMEDVENFRS